MNRNNKDSPLDHSSLSAMSGNGDTLPTTNGKIHLESNVRPSNMDLCKSCLGSLVFNQTLGHVFQQTPFSIESLNRIPKDFTSSKHSHCDRGKFLHKLIAANLVVFFSPPQNPYYETLLESLLTQSPTTREFVDACTRYVQEKFSEDTSQRIYIEYPLDCLKDYNIDGCCGRCDFALVSTNAAEIVDFKTGTEPVDPSTSLQLLCYAAAMKNLHPNIMTFTLTILQSSAKTPHSASSYYLTADELDTRIQNEVLPLVLRCEAGELAFETGVHCSKCPHLYKCAAGLQCHLVPIFKEIETTIASSGAELGTEDFVPFIHLKSALSTPYHDWREQIINDEMKGEIFPNIVVRKSTKEVYTDEDAVVNILQSNGIDPYVRTLISPAMARKKLGNESYTQCLSPLVQKVPHSSSIIFQS